MGVCLKHHFLDVLRSACCALAGDNRPRGEEVSCCRDWALLKVQGLGFKV